MLSRRILRRRYRLLPLLLKLARTASSSGLPLLRPLWLHHEVPAEHFGLAATQVMLGEDLLAAPVLEKGARKRRVWLPPGSWIELRNARVHRHLHPGGWVVDVDAPLGETPLFVRGGVPFFFAAAGKNAEDTLKGALALELLAPSSEPSSATLLLEDGTSTRAPWALHARAIDDDGQVRIDLDVDMNGAPPSPDGSFLPVQSSIEVRVPSGFSAAEVDGVVVPVTQKNLAAEDRSVVVAAFDVPLSARLIKVT
jgi:alpha-glucosidase